MSKFIVATTDLGSTTGVPGKVVYLGVDPDKVEEALDQWWWVAPGDAADREGSLDYTRFADEAEAVSWYHVVRSHYDQSDDPAVRNRPVWIREIG